MMGTLDVHHVCSQFFFRKVFIYMLKVVQDVI